MRSAREEPQADVDAGTSRRRLLAVAFADIVGYTRLSSEDEGAAMELVEILQALSRTLVDDAEGRVVKFLGDGALLEFSSAEAAVEAGLRLSAAFEEEAEVGVEGFRACLRTGVHLGEATVTPDGDVYGDVVNVASRIQSAAEPGELLVSRDVWRQLHRRPVFRFGEAVERKLKGIDEPLATFPVRPRFEEPPGDPQPAPSEDETDQTRLAVLPFRILRPDPEIDFLEFSLPDAVACSLVGVSSLVVRATSSVMQYAGTSPDPREVGREANVDLVLAGTILRAGEKVRVATQLSEGSDGTLLWNETATVSMGDLFELQDALARRIVSSLSGPLDTGGAEEPTRDRDQPHSGAGYELYLRANQVAIQGGDWAGGVELYEAALEKDPEYAPAWARLGRCHRLIGKYSGDSATTKERFARAEEALQRALELDPDLALAHSYLAQLEVEQGHAIEGMGRLLRRVSESGRAVDFFIGLTHACRYAGLLDASRKAHEIATEMDPEAVTSIPFTHLLAGEYEEAIRTSEPGAWSVIHAQIHLGRGDAATEVIEDFREGISGQALRNLTNALLAAARGDRETAVERGWKAVEGFSDPEGRFQLAAHWADLGALDDALTLIETAVDGGFHCAQALQALPIFEPLRDRPEFGALLERAEAGRAAALKAFRAEGGPGILGVKEA